MPIAQQQLASFLRSKGGFCQSDFEFIWPGNHSDFERLHFCRHRWTPVVDAVVKATIIVIEIVAGFVP